MEAEELALSASSLTCTVCGLRGCGHHTGVGPGLYYALYKGSSADLCPGRWKIDVQTPFRDTSCDVTLEEAQISKPALKDLGSARMRKGIPCMTLDNQATSS